MRSEQDTTRTSPIAANGGSRAAIDLPQGVTFAES
jgi:hypothetical protein